MSILIFLVTGVLAAIGVRLLMPRSGVGGWVGDLIMGWVGAGLGTYLMASYNLGHALDNYDLLVLINAFGTAVAFLVIIHWLSRRIPEANDADDDDLAMV
jgi:uncharacterized membrane protein YeaQ/YmgE (transglycosylase-associated protein family)